MFDHLFSPLALGGTTLPNRVCFLAHRTNFAKRGRLDGRHVAYYARRARGGCGLIIVGELCIHPNDRPWEPMVELYGPQALEDLRELTQAVHAFGVPVFAQLTHHGFQSSGAVTRRCVWGPSAVADIAFGETAKPMEPEDIAEVVEAFASAAALVREAGFDGVEVDMGPESLLRQFLSPLSNHRQDAWGGELENRMRLPMEVLAAVRRSAGEDFTVGIRLCADEKFWGAITLDESREMARAFEGRGGARFINVAVGTYYNLHLFMPSMHTPFGFTVETAEAVRNAVSIPVLASHQIDTPERADEIIRAGRGDAVGLIRNLICDPDWPVKACDGRLDEIRPCVRDNQGCIGQVNTLKALGCIQNPDVGYETLAGRAPEHGQTLEKPRKAGILRFGAGKRRVLVVGAGPAGLEAARAAAAKGHDVSVHEKGPAIGGQVALAARGAGRERLLEVIHHLARRLARLNVPIFLGQEVTAAWVEEQAPEVVIVATGSVPDRRPLPGEYGPPGVLSVWEVLDGSFPVGETVLFVDENGGHRAAATVERLADGGRKVDMVTGELFIGLDLGPIGDLYLTRQRLLQKGVTFITDVTLERLEGTRAQGRYLYTNEPLAFEGYDTVVLEIGSRAEDRLYRELKGRVGALYRAGDCVAPRGIGMAVFEGRKAGERA